VSKAVKQKKYRLKYDTPVDGIDIDVTVPTGAVFRRVNGTGVSVITLSKDFT
jgi:hypothetical protein